MKCKASLLVTTHSLLAGRNLARSNQFTVKRSMHEPSCSLSKELNKEPAKKVTIQKLPPIGNKVTVLKGAFSAKGIL